MSLIADALKTAQREKLRRESGGVPSMSPVLVPIRSKAQPIFSWQRALTIGISVVVIVAAIAVMVDRMKRPRASLSALPPITSPLPSTATPDDNARRGPGESTIARVRVSRDATGPSSARSRQPSRANASVAAQPAQVNATKNAGAILQGQLRADSIAAGTPARAREVLSAGRLRIAVEQPPVQPEAGRLFAEALAAHRAGELATAQALYERVLLLAPNHADALNNLGVLLSGQREFDRALDLLRRAASIAPRSAGIWNNIGTALREQGRGSDAVAAFRHALTMDPQHQGARVGLAQQYLAIGSVAEARRLLEDVLATNPSLPEAHYALGQALELQGDRVGAIRAYFEFIRRAPPGLSEYAERTRRHVDSLSSRAP
jgi:Tfp pilus assembly protein PilF